MTFEEEQIESRLISKNSKHFRTKYFLSKQIFGRHGGGKNPVFKSPFNFSYWSLQITLHCKRIRVYVLVREREYSTKRCTKLMRAAAKNLDFGFENFFLSRFTFHWKRRKFVILWTQESFFKWVQTTTGIYFIYFCPFLTIIRGNSFYALAIFSLSSNVKLSRLTTTVNRPLVMV